MVQIAPSILSADFANLGAAVDKMKDWKADYVHLDVMDGCFVSSITFGHPMIKALKKHTAVPFDVHLMIENPSKWIATYKAAGADIFTFHAEADRHIHRTIQAIQKCEMKAGVALNPGTPLSAIECVLDIVDLVLIMSVNPGAPAQEFIPYSLEKIRTLSDMLCERGRENDVIIEVDGGVNENTSKHCIAAGANLLVAGSSVFSAANPKQMIQRLRCEEE